MDRTGRLSNKRAAITGAGAGIGLAAAQLFAREGASVALLDIKTDPAQASADAIKAAGGEALFIPTDVTQADSMATALKRAADAFGGLDIMYNNAGGATAKDGKITEIPIDEFWRTISVDLFGTFLGCRFAIPLLEAAGGGSIINTTSIRAMKATLGADAYTSAKGGVLTLTRALAKECAPANIRVNAIAPGAVLTERTRSMGMRGDDQRQSDPGNPYRTGRPEEIAAMALFLASDESSLVNGAIIPVDSGSSVF